MVMVQDAAARKLRGFLSYAHADLPLVQRFRALLGLRLENILGLDTSMWWDDHILVGQMWDDEIRTALREADFGLVLVSPTLLSRDYIRRVEIPAFLTAPEKPLLTVGLQQVDLGRCDLQGLEAHQIFRLRTADIGEPKWFADLGGQNPARFCDKLAGQIADRLLSLGS